MLDIDASHEDEPVAIRPFGRALPMLLLQAREVTLRKFRPVLAAHRVSEQQWRILRALTDASEPLSVGELAEATFLLGPSIARMLPSLADRGLVQRATGAADGRRAEISISSSGRRLVASIAPETEARYGEIAEHLGAHDLEHLHELLERLAEME